MRQFGLLLAGVVLVLPGTACSMGKGGPRVHIESVEDRTLTTADVRILDAKTHNGHIAVTAGDTDEIILHITKKAYGLTMAEAEEAMDALEVVTEQAGDVQRVFWRWKVPKGLNWSAGVSYDITVPERLAARLKTHNGPIELSGIEGDTDVETHNGKILVDTHSNLVKAEAHNGHLTVMAPASEVYAKTHNGGVKLNLTKGQNVTGTVKTHNGAVLVTVTESASANLDCKTHNGAISMSLPVEVVSKSRRRMSAKFGDASGKLKVQTHNGAIRVRKQS